MVQDDEEFRVEFPPKETVRGRRGRFERLVKEICVSIVRGTGRWTLIQTSEDIYTVFRVTSAHEV